jgi:polyhydroxyalkanoate synthase subunit PhaC
LDNTARKLPEPPAIDDNHPALGAILGANPFVGFDARQVIETLSLYFGHLASHPASVANRMVQLMLELGQVAAGVSAIEPEPSDKRFADPAWTDHPIFRRTMQTYLAWRQAMHDLVANEDEYEWREREQQKFAVTLMTEAAAPTNSFLINPAALKRAFETGGMSLVRGAGNFLADLWNNGGMPSTVDKRPFRVGGNLGVTPGAVVHRTPIFELIQYAPATDKVFTRPLVLIPPQINKFYIMDLAPGRSFVEYASKHGVPMFAISWRNAKPENRNWSLDEYVNSCKEAIAAACEITGSADANVLGICAGGITTSLLLGHLTASDDHRVNAATLLVTMLDTSLPTMTGMFATDEAIKAAVDRSAKAGVLSGADMARVFAWLRPNDLVWNYWVNNYLLGNSPAPFDILYWNADSTNLPARLHAGFLDIFQHNSLTRKDAVKILGTPVDLRAVKNDMYLVAGMTDHICAWRACYRSTHMFGGKVEFVLGSSGHIQSLVSPPGNFKARYLTGARMPDDADEWLSGATENKGTWWDHWLKWIASRSGDEKAAPPALGNERFKPIEAAPGTYVHQQL